MFKICITLKNGQGYIKQGYIKKNIVFLCISVFPKFYAFTLKSNKNVPFRNALRLSSPNHNFHSTFTHTLF